MKRRFHQRAEGLDEHMRRQLNQGAEIGPCIELGKVGETTGRLKKRVSRVSCPLATHSLLTLLARLRVLRRQGGE
jgi:hypothetical protein